MLQQSIPLPTTMVTQGDIEGPYSNSTGTLQRQTGYNPSTKAVTTYPFYTELFTCFAPYLGVCSHIRKLFAVFPLKERWFSLLSEETERMGPSEVLGPAPVDAQRNSIELQHHVLQPPAYTLQCHIFSRPYFSWSVPFLTSLTGSLSYLNVKKHFSKYSFYFCTFLSLKSYLGDKSTAFLLKCVSNILKIKLLQANLSVLSPVPCDAYPDQEPKKDGMPKLEHKQV